MPNNGGVQSSITLNVSAQIDNLKQIQSDLQQALQAGVNSNSGIFKALSNALEQVITQTRRLTVESEKPFSSQKGIEKFNSDFVQTSNLTKRIANTMANLKFSELKIPPEALKGIENATASVQEAQAKLQALDTTKLAELAEKGNEITDVFSRAKVDITTDGLEKSLKKVSDLIVNTEKEISKLTTKAETSKLIIDNLDTQNTELSDFETLLNNDRKTWYQNNTFGKFFNTQGTLIKNQNRDAESELQTKLREYGFDDQQVAKIIASIKGKAKEIAEARQEALDIINNKKTSNSSQREKERKNLSESEAAITTLTAEQEVNKGTKQELLDVKNSDDYKAAVEQLEAEVERLKQELNALKEATRAGAEATKAGQKAYEGASANMSNFGKEVDNATDSLGKMQKAASNANSIKTAIANWMGFHQILNLGRRMIRNVIKDIQDLDKVMTEIAVVTNMTQKDLWAQMNTYQAIAREYAVSTQGVYQVSQIYYQQGLQTAEVMELTVETLKMAKIANLDYSKAADYMTVAIRGFHLEMDQASHIVDVYSKIAAVSASDTEELATAMSKTASSAAAVGSSFENTTAFIALMVETTRESAENIGSALKSIISRYGELKTSPDSLIDSEGEAMSFNKVETALQSVGISMHDVNGQFRDFDDVIIELSSKWDTLDMNTQRYIATVMAGNRQQSRFIALVSDYDRLSELVEEAANADDAATLQTLKTMDSLESKIQNLKNAWQGFYANLGLEEVFKGALDGITTIINRLNGMPKVLGKIPAAAVLLISNLIKVIKTLLTNLINYSVAQTTQLREAIRKAISEGAKEGKQEAQATLSKWDLYKSRFGGSGGKAAVNLVGQAGQLASAGLGAYALTMGDDKAKARARVQGGSAILNAVSSIAIGGATGGPIGALWGLLSAAPSAIAGIVTAIDDWRNAQQKLVDSYDQQIEKQKQQVLVSKNEAKTIVSAIKKYEDLKNKQYESNEAQAEFIEYQSTLIDQYPELLAYVDAQGNGVLDVAKAYGLMAVKIKQARQEELLLKQKEEERATFESENIGILLGRISLGGKNSDQIKSKQFQDWVYNALGINVSYAALSSSDNGGLAQKIALQNIFGLTDDDIMNLFSHGTAGMEDYYLDETVLNQLFNQENLSFSSILSNLYSAWSQGIIKDSDFQQYVQQLYNFVDAKGILKDSTFKEISGGIDFSKLDDLEEGEESIFTASTFVKDLISFFDKAKDITAHKESLAKIEAELSEVEFKVTEYVTSIIQGEVAGLSKYSGRADIGELLNQGFFNNLVGLTIKHTKTENGLNYDAKGVTDEEKQQIIDAQTEIFLGIYDSLFQADLWDDFTELMSHGEQFTNSGALINSVRNALGEDIWNQIGSDLGPAIVNYYREILVPSIEKAQDTFFQQYTGIMQSEGKSGAQFLNIISDDRFKNITSQFYPMLQNLAGQYFSTSSDYISSAIDTYLTGLQNELFLMGSAQETILFSLMKGIDYSDPESIKQAAETMRSNFPEIADLLNTYAESVIINFNTYSQKIIEEAQKGLTSLEELFKTQSKGFTSLEEMNKALESARVLLDQPDLLLKDLFIYNKELHAYVYNQEYLAQIITEKTKTYSNLISQVSDFSGQLAQLSEPDDYNAAIADTNKTLLERSFFAYAQSIKANGGTWQDAIDQINKGFIDYLADQGKIYEQLAEDIQYSDALSNFPIKEILAGTIATVKNAQEKIENWLAIQPEEVAEVYRQLIDELKAGTATDKDWKNLYKLLKAAEVEDAYDEAIKYFTKDLQTNMSTLSNLLGASLGSTIILSEEQIRALAAAGYYEEKDVDKILASGIQSIQVGGEGFTIALETLLNQATNALRKGQITLDQYNKQVTQVAAFSDKEWGATPIIDAFGKASSLTADAVADIASSLGFTLSEDFDFTELKGITTDYNGHQMVTDMQSFIYSLYTQASDSIKSFDDLEINWNDPRIVEAQSKLNEAFIQQQQAMLEAQTKQLSAIGSVKPGQQFLDLSYVWKELGENARKQLAQAISDAGAHIGEDTGLLELGNASIFNVAEAIKNSGALDQTEEALAALEDAIISLLESLTDLLSKGLEGSLSNTEALDFSKMVSSRYGIEIDFTETEKGLKLSADSAEKLAQQLYKAGTFQEKLAFKEYAKSLAGQAGTYKDIYSTMQKLKKLETERAEKNGDITEDLRYQLALTREIAYAQMADTESYNFMDFKMPSDFNGPANYWSSWETFMSKFREAKTNGYMEIEDFYNMVNAVNAVATEDNPITIFGTTLNGSLEKAADLIERGLGTIGQIDGKGAMITFKDMGDNIFSGMESFGTNVDKGIHEFAQSQINMIDALIGFVQAMAIMEKMGDLDIDKSGFLSLGELFESEWVSDAEGPLYKIYTTINNQTKTVLEAILANEEYTKALEQFSINGHTGVEVIQGVLENNTEMGQLLVDWYNLAAQMDYDITDIDSIYQSIKDGAIRLGKDTEFDFTIGEGDQQRTISIKQGVAIEYAKDTDGWKWITSDGKSYEAEQAAREHEVELIKQRTIDNWAKEQVVGELNDNKFTVAGVTIDLQVDGDNITFDGRSSLEEALEQKLHAEGYAGSAKDILATEFQLRIDENGNLVELTYDQQQAINTQETIQNAAESIDKGITTVEAATTATKNLTEALMGKRLTKIATEAALIGTGEEVGGYTVSMLTAAAAARTRLAEQEVPQEEDYQAVLDANAKAEAAAGAWQIYLSGIQAIMDSLETDHKAEDADRSELDAKTAKSVENKEGIEIVVADEAGHQEMGEKGQQTLMDSLKTAFQTFFTSPFFTNIGTSINPNYEFLHTGSLGKSIGELLAEAGVTNKDKDQAGWEGFAKLWSKIDEFARHHYFTGKQWADPEYMAKYGPASQSESTTQSEPVETADEETAEGVQQLISVTQAQYDALQAYVAAIKTDSISANLTAMKQVKEASVPQEWLSAASLNSQDLSQVFKVIPGLSTIEGLNDNLRDTEDNWIRVAEQATDAGSAIESSGEDAASGLEEAGEAGKSAAPALRSIVAPATRASSGLLTLNMAVPALTTAISSAITSINSSYARLSDASVAPAASRLAQNRNPNLSTKATGSFGNALAAGTLMGELGPELWVSHGHYYVAGQNGAEFVNLPDDAIVFNHLQTERLLGKGKAGGHGKPVTNERKATSLATGNVHGGLAMASASDTLAQLKQLRAMWEAIAKMSVSDLGKKAGSGGGGGGGGDKDNKAFIHDLERWFSLEQEILRLEKAITKEQKTRAVLMSDQVINGEKIYASYRREYENLKDRINATQELANLQHSYYEKRQEDLNKSLVSQIFTFDKNGVMKYKGYGDERPGSMGGLDILATLNRTGPNNEPIGPNGQKWDAGGQVDFLTKALAVSKDDLKASLIKEGAELGEKATDEDILQAWYDLMDSYQSELTELYDSWTTHEDEVLEMQADQNQIIQDIIDNQLSLEQRVLTALIDQAQKVIDDLQDSRDALADANQKYIDGLNDSLQKQRDMYDRNESANELNKLQRQLAILQRSGGSASQIRSLQQQIGDQMQDAYFTAQQDQIDAIKEATDKQIERLDYQIDLMTKTLEYQEENGLLWRQVYDKMNNNSPEQLLSFIMDNTASMHGQSTRQTEQDMIEIGDEIGIYKGDLNGVKEGEKEFEKGLSEEDYTIPQSYEEWKALHDKNMEDLKEMYDKMLETEQEIAQMSNGSGSDSGSGGGSGTNIVSKSNNSNKTNITKPNDYSNMPVNPNTVNTKNEAGNTGNLEEQYGFLVLHYLSVNNTPIKSPDVKRLKSGKVNVESYKKTIAGYKFQNAFPQTVIVPAGGNSVVATLYYRSVQIPPQASFDLGSGFANGGLVDYTGPAQVHGSKSKPESFFDAQSTAILRDDVLGSINVLDSLLADVSTAGTNSLNLGTSESLSIANPVININVDKIANDYDAKRAGQLAFDEMVKIARQSGNRSLSRR